MPKNTPISGVARAVFIPSEMATSLEAEARKQGATISRIIREALNEHLIQQRSVSVFANRLNPDVTTKVQLERVVACMNTALKVDGESRDPLDPSCPYTVTITFRGIDFETARVCQDALFMIWKTLKEHTL